MMDKQILSAIHFKNYIVETINFDINSEFSSRDEVDLDMSFDNVINIDADEHAATIQLSCSIFENYKEKDYPFHIFVRLIALFDYVSELPPDKARDMLELNGVSIVFPYLRSTISTITASAGITPLVIPTINIVKMLKKTSEERTGEEAEKAE